MRARNTCFSQDRRPSHPSPTPILQIPQAKSHAESELASDRSLGQRLGLGACVLVEASCCKGNTTELGFIPREGRPMCDKAWLRQEDQAVSLARQHSPSTLSHPAAGTCTCLDFEGR